MSQQQQGLMTVYGRAEGGVFGRFNEHGEGFLYMQRELKEWKIVLKDREGKRVIIPQAMQMLGAKCEEWNGQKMYVLSDTLFFLHNKRGGIDMRLVHEFGTGFFLGIMFQRMIVNKGIQLEITERTITAVQMDEAIKEIGK